MEKAVNPDNTLDGLVALVKTLRSDHGCPWDRAQTPEKIKVYVIEEAYEVLEALESGTSEDVCAELGDLLFHIVFLARQFEEVGDFNVHDVIQGITEKMIRRHPHVFGEADVSSVDDVKAQWHEIKAAEALEKDENQGHFLDGIPKKLPVMMQAYRLGERASRVGFDSVGIQGVLDGLIEFKDVLEKGDPEKSTEEFGDLLFAMVNLSRFIGVHPEIALAQASSKFVRRFKYVEGVLKEQGRTVESASIEEMNSIWDECRTGKETQT